MTKLVVIKEVQAHFDELADEPVEGLLESMQVMEKECPDPIPAYDSTSKLQMAWALVTSAHGNPLKEHGNNFALAVRKSCPNCGSDVKVRRVSDRHIGRNYFSFKARCTGCKFRVFIPDAWAGWAPDEKNYSVVSRPGQLP